MTFVGCSIPEQYVNPLFEVFEGGDFVLSSWRDIKRDLTDVRIYLEDAAQTPSAKTALEAALALVGVKAAVTGGTLPDEDWKLSYRKHFKTERIGRRLIVIPTWEEASVPNDGRVRIVLDPGLAFGTGKHETTRACLEYLDEIASEGEVGSFLDMGCGSGILSIAAEKLGFSPVVGFDVDAEAVEASRENATLNGVKASFAHFALGRAATEARVDSFPKGPYDTVAANILGPLLIRFADEITPYVGRFLIVSGILNELYDEVVAAFAARGFREISRRTQGEWTTGRLTVIR